MGKNKNHKVAYVARKKIIPGTSTFFTGVILVPEGGNSGLIFTNICDFFDGNQANVRGLEDKAEVDEAWKNLTGDIADEIFTEEEMPETCWKNLQNQLHFSVQEFRALMKKTKTKPDRKSVKGGQAIVNVTASLGGQVSMGDTICRSGSAKMGDSADLNNQASGSGIANTGRTVNMMGTANRSDQITESTTEVKEVSVEVSNNMKGVNNGAADAGKEKLVWAFLEPDGTFGEHYIFDDDMENEMMEILKQKDQAAPAKFIMNCGVLLIPNLQKENFTLRERLAALETESRGLRQELQAITADRDVRVLQAMDRGSTAVEELTKARRGKEIAEITTASLKEQVKELTEMLKGRDGKWKDISERLDKLEERSKKTEKNTEIIVTIVGTAKDKRANLWTPAAEKLTSLEARVVLVAREDFFRVSQTYRSLRGDMERLKTKSILNKVVLDGTGVVLASEFHAKQVAWGEESQVVLIIDGAEGTAAEVVATVLNIPLGANKGRKTLVVAGPTSDGVIEAYRKTIMEKLAIHDNVTTLNMSEVARKVGDIKKFEEDGTWSPLAAAYLLSMIGWWVEKIKSKSGVVEDPVICTECGFIHTEAKDCMKEEVPKPASGGARREDRNQEERLANNNINKRRPCDYCGKGHGGECWNKPGAVKKLKR